jgi:hypothetical protein
VNAVGPDSGHVIGERCFTTFGLNEELLLGAIPQTKRSEIGLVTDRVLSLALRTARGDDRPVPIIEGFFATAYQHGDTLLASTKNGIRTLQSP